MNLTPFLSLADFEAAARRTLPHAVYGYVFGGTEDSLSVKANRAVFDRLGFRPRGLTGVANRSQSVNVWGTEYPSPVGIAPMGVTAICRYRCDMDLAVAARSRGLPYVLSGASNVALEDIQENPGGAWYQGYFPGDKQRLERIVQRLLRANVQVLVVTSDTPVAANRENNQRNGFTIPFRPSWRLLLDGMLHPSWSCGVFLKTLRQDGIPRFLNLYEEPGPAITAEPEQGFRGGRDLLTWEHMSWLRDLWPGKLVVKGIMHPGDAEIAVKRGMDAVIVSNHGGRQLDGAMPALAALPGIKAAVPEDFPLMIDGGFRRGTDVLKAVALGARLVFIGRPALYGASVAGAEGAGKVLDILRQEIDRNLALLGCENINELNTDYLDPVQLRSFIGRPL
ncbi:alpha-hydroxy acid oxidase [Pusillimonas sp. SM2304]|uniref:alpha-hydroxy acid oxidase n=1 Tax=Pusillimonas sp. SM2304 TaxID=3073241 RepID=UPI002875FD86|nr:alpha-hydroxy acid oxidase [Pusillimonas sp. SM2304]MDS1139124.1 alpha-hydroxy acid oxidase [Pusillimonas sp. SM2304]